MSRGPAVRFATAIARTLLRLYPRPFRSEMGGPLVEDVCRRARALVDRRGRVGYALWLPRLTASLLANAFGAWFEPRVRARAAAGRASSRISWLDLKLGARMLVKYPFMTLTAGLGIAVAIAVSGGFFAFGYAMFFPTIPLDEGDRLVGLENWDLERNNEDRRSLWDFFVWREQMRSVEDMTAFQNVSRNLILGDGSVELIDVAEITPSGFDLARVPPMMGRTLVEADAQRDAPPVLVIGFDVWRTRFAADPEIIGKDVRLGPVVHTIVGVMPRGFGFPLSHSYWTPLKAAPLDYERGEGPFVYISGRLAPGYELEDAKTELAVVGERMAAAFPDTHARFRTQVMPYAYPLVDVNHDGGESNTRSFAAMTAFISLLLVVIALNVAVLVYARTATRRGEIAVRTALGAGRARIVAQMFAESFVLAGLAAVFGLGLAAVGMHLGNLILETEIGGAPFWMELGIPGPALLYIVGLTALAAAITGILPALQATSKRVQANLAQFHSGAGLRLGRTWTTLVVVQVAITVVALPAALATGWWEVRSMATLPTIPLDTYLTASLEPEPGVPLGMDEEEHRTAVVQQLGVVRSELARRLESEPAVAAYTFGGIPTLAVPTRVLLEGEGEADAGLSGAGHAVEVALVEPEFFEMFGLAPLTGRVFGRADMAPGAPEVVVVNRTFVRRIAEDGNVVGRRLQFLPANAERPDALESAPWHEIVGAVEDMRANPLDPDLVPARVYRVATQERLQPLYVALRLAGMEPSAYAQRLRELVAEIDPSLRVFALTLDDAYVQNKRALTLTALAVSLGVLSVLLLSAAGIYAMMSFAVTQRRREIGIRTALGAQRRVLLGGIFGRAATQIGAGVMLGLAVAVGMDHMADGGLLLGYGPWLLTGMVVVMGAVGLLAALGPARSGLSIEPVEALREG